MNKICGIYKITNMVNGKYIIGQSRDINNRWKAYRNKLRSNKYYNPHLQRSWNKYGEQNFKFEIILECTEDKLNEEEIRLIKKYNATDRNIGYNIDEGGNGHNQSAESRKKISDAHKGKKLSEETKHKLSILRTGVKRPASVSEKLKGNTNALGYQHTEETKQKMSIDRMGSKNNHFGKEHSLLAKQKMSIKRKGVPKTEEWKKQHSECMKGNQINLGRKHTKESRENMSKAHQKRPPFSLETREKISQKKKLYWANKKATQLASNK